MENQNVQNQRLFSGFTPHPTQCRRCGRMLTSPASVAAGIGKYCARRELAAAASEDQRPTSHRYLHTPITQGLIIRRDADGTLETNVPRIACNHSPDGFEAGYGGSGPADFALNTVEAILIAMGYEGPRSKASVSGEVFDITWQLYQNFKWAFIAGFKKDTIIPYPVLRNWLKKQIEKVETVANEYGIDIGETAAA